MASKGDNPTAATVEDTPAPVEVQGDNDAPAGTVEDTPAPVVLRVLAPALDWIGPTGRPRHASQGARRSDIPPQAHAWLLAGGYVEVVAEAADTPEADQGD